MVAKQFFKLKQLAKQVAVSKAGSKAVLSVKVEIILEKKFSRFTDIG